MTTRENMKMIFGLFWMVTLLLPLANAFQLPSLQKTTSPQPQSLRLPLPLSLQQTNTRSRYLHPQTSSSRLYESVKKRSDKEKDTSTLLDPSKVVIDDDDDDGDDTNSNMNSTGPLSSKRLVDDADANLAVEQAISTAAKVVINSSSERSSDNDDDASKNGVVGTGTGDDDDDEVDDDSSSSSPLNRRLFMASALIGTGAAVAGGIQTNMGGLMSIGRDSSSNGGGDEIMTTQNNNYNMRPYTSKLAWEVTPVNKRTGVTVFDAEKAGYNVRFVTYLSRFLLCFDLDCQRWWYNRAADIPRRASLEQVEKVRLQQFGAFSASVEVGLQEYRGVDGPSQLMESLLTRYCRPIETIREVRAQRGLPPLSEQDEQLEKREILEARRQVALLFGLMDANQPVEAITKVLAAIDNGSVVSVTIESGGTGYAPGYGPPLVEFPLPKAGGPPTFERATGRATLSPNGMILRIDVINRGIGYSKPPIVTVTSPGADRGVTVPGSAPAQGKAFLFKKGANKGRVQQIVLTDPGKGYVEGEEIRITLSPPELEPQNGGVTATAKAILEYSVSGIQIIKGGNGYAVEKPIPVYVEAPPLTARLNMNDPLNARMIDSDQPLPATSRMTPEQRKKMPDPNDPNSVVATIDRLARNEGKGGGGGCIGRACYDSPVIAYATAQANTTSFSTFRKNGDAMKPVQEEEAIRKSRFVSGTTSGFEGSAKPSPLFWTGNGGASSSSKQLLTLLPEGIGLEYDTTLNRFVLAAGENFAELNEPWMKGLSSNRALEPEFGPRGRSPIERDVQLNFQSYIRFCLSGAICCSGVHLALTPIDVVKTKVQTDPKKYPTAVVAFQTLVEEGGLGGFFAGWAPTFIGFFFWGGFSYSLTEFLRRYFIEAAGADAMQLEVPIILTASAIGSFFGAFILSPFEAVRIRSVAQPDYGGNVFEVTNRMVKEEGFLSLFSIVPPFWLKEVPFAMAKFTVFDLFTKYLYETFPVAREDVQLSLLVSLAGGTLGGLCAAIASNPGDATVSEMKKAKTDMGMGDAIKVLLDREGPSSLFRGLPLRMAFYPLVVSLQFLVYDAVRLSLGIGADDLKVYLDVLGGALKDGGSMVGPV